MISILTKTGLFLGLFMLISCNSEPSLQRYFVDSSENPEFQNISLSPQNFIKNTESLSKEDKQQLENIRKLNVLMFQNKAENNLYETELGKVESILNQEQYKSLFSAGEPNKRMQMLYVGEGEKIKEIIIYGKDESIGFILARILGDDLNPQNLYKIMLLGDQLDMGELEESIKQFTDA